MPGTVTSIINPGVMCCNYSSPQDFSATYTSGLTITCAGAPFTIDDANCTVMFIRVKPLNGPWLPPLINGQVSIVAAANVLTVAGAGATPFHTGDTYRIGVFAQDKGYVQASDAYRYYEIDPLDLKVVEESLVEGTVAADCFLPSDDGILLLGAKSLSLNGSLTQAHATDLVLKVWATNHESATPASRTWVQIFGYRSDTNTMVNSITANSVTGVVTYGWDFDNLNYKYVRVGVTVGDATNTTVIKIRRMAL